MAELAKEKPLVSSAFLFTFQSFNYGGFNMNEKSAYNYIIISLFVLLSIYSFSSCGSSGGGTTQTETDSNGETSADVQLDTDAAKSKVIEPSTCGIIEASTGHKLEIPPGAVSETVNITLTPFKFPDDPELGAYGGVKLEPSGLQFISEAILTIKLSKPFPPGTALQLAELVDEESVYVDLGTMFTVSDTGLEASGPIYRFSNKILWRNCHAGTRSHLVSTWSSVPTRDIECLTKATGLTTEKLTDNDPKIYDNFDGDDLSMMLKPYFYECYNFGPGEQFTAESHVRELIDSGREVVMLFGKNIDGDKGDRTGFIHSTWIIKKDEQLFIRGQLNIKKKSTFKIVQDEKRLTEVDFPLRTIDDYGGIRDTRAGEIMSNYVKREYIDRDNIPNKVWPHVVVYCEKEPTDDKDGDCIEDDSDSFSVTINIPGFPLSFNPTLVIGANDAAATGDVNVSNVPTIFAFENAMSLSLEMFALYFDPRQIDGPGDYILRSLDQVLMEQIGEASIVYVDNEIKNVDDGTPVVFTSTGGTVSLTKYGENDGDKLVGTFSATISGDRVYGVDANADPLESTVTGTMNGSFNVEVK